MQRMQDKARRAAQENFQLHKQWPFEWVGETAYEPFKTPIMIKGIVLQICVNSSWNFQDQQESQSGLMLFCSCYRLAGMGFECSKVEKALTSSTVPLRLLRAGQVPTICRVSSVAAPSSPGTVQSPATSPTHVTSIFKAGQLPRHARLPSGLQKARPPVSNRDIAGTEPKRSSLAVNIT